MQKISKPFKIRGLKKRWMLNSVAVVVVVVIIAVSAFSVSIAANYYSGIQTGLETKAKTATEFFSTYVTRTYAEYYQSAYNYTESFEDRDKIELQFVSSSGKVLVSTNGLTAGSSPNTPEVDEAIKTMKMKMWSGKNPSTGERIMAVSSPLIYGDDEVIGIMRFVTSLSLVDKQVVISTLVIAGIGVLVILAILLSNTYFIRSIIVPIKEITAAAKRIADGGYGIQINKNYDDEIGDMVDTINEMSMKISRSEKMQSEFISSISHELRTPLTAITGWGETLMYDDTIGGDAKRGIAIIQKEAGRLTNMVEELLEFTRIEDGRFTLNIEQVDIGAEVEDAIFIYGELLRQDDITLEYDPCDEELPLIPGDAERLKQVFLNVLDNANKYGKSGKRIIVSTLLENIDGKEYAVIKIRDFGPGIPEDELPHVKMKFYKGSSKERGSGIGLAVCDEIVRFHNGILDIANAEGGGVEVSIKLPTTESTI